MEQTTQDKIEAYLKKNGFCKRTGTDVWYMGRAPHTRIVDMGQEPPWCGISTGVQNQEAEECGIEQIVYIKNEILFIYNASIKKLPGTGCHNPALSQEGSDGPPRPIPNASPPAPGGESHPVTKSWKELNPMMEAPGSFVPGSGLSAPAPKVYRCTDCKKQIDKEQAEMTFKELERALCGPCAIYERGARE